jgi:hypothetical protein
MRQLRIHPILFGCLVLLLTASLLVACDEEQVVPPPPDSVLASGIVMAMPLQTPLGGATIQLITNEFQFLTDLQDPNYVAPCDCQGDLCSVNTTSNPDGSWEMEVPFKYDETLAPFPMLIKVSEGSNPPQYNLFQPAAPTYQGDLQILTSFFYNFFALTSGSSLSDVLGGQLSVFLGVAIGIIDTDYPQEIATIPGVTATAEGGDPPVEFPVTYFLGDGETSDLGVYYFSVQNANREVPSVYISAEKPGLTFVRLFFPACPGSSSGVASIDAYFQPLQEGG